MDWVGLDSIEVISTYIPYTLPTIYSSSSAVYRIEVEGSGSVRSYLPSRSSEGRMDGECGLSEMATRRILLF